MNFLFPGLKIGKWTVIQQLPQETNGTIRVVVQCECGALERKIRQNLIVALKRGTGKGCKRCYLRWRREGIGCARKQRSDREVLETRFGDFRAKKKIRCSHRVGWTYKHAKWKFECVVCGFEKESSLVNMKDSGSVCYLCKRYELLTMRGANPNIGLQRQKVQTM